LKHWYYYHWVYTYAGGQLVLGGIICPVVSLSTLTSNIRFNYYWNVQFHNNVVIIKN